ncbi:MAG: cytochrome c [Stappiaceae bacterium]
MKLQNVTRLSVLAVSATLMTVSLAVSQDDPVKARQESMKQVGAATGAMGKMVKGEIDYDAAAAEKAMTQIRDAAEKFADKFPEGSDQGKTEAAPKIWEDKEGFKTATAKLHKDADGAIAAAGTDLDSLKASFGKVASNCKSCHETYRVKKN